MAKSKIIDGFPQQPIAFDKYGVVRFQKNEIVDDLLVWATEHGYSLNDIARRPYSDTDRQQFAQLIGYSVSGFGDLSYSSKKVVEHAKKEVDKLYTVVNPEQQ